MNVKKHRLLCLKFFHGFGSLGTGEFISWFLSNETTLHRI